MLHDNDIYITTDMPIIYITTDMPITQLASILFSCYSIQIC